MDENTLQTPRLALRPLLPGDAERVYAYRSLPEVYRYQGWSASSLEDARRFIENYALAEPVDDGNWKQLGIRMADTGELIGDCGFRVFEDRQAEIGYTIAPDAQHRGFGTETVTGLVAWLFFHQNLHRIIATTDPENRASIRILEKIGFRREGHFLKSIFLRGEWKDDLVFAVLREEWMQKQRSGESRSP